MDKTHSLPVDLLMGTLEMADELALGPEFFQKKQGTIVPKERYTGARVLRDPTLVRAVAGMMILGYSGREIESSSGVDHRLHALCLAEADRQGWIPALKERLGELSGRVAEEAFRSTLELLDEARDGKRSLELAAMLKSVGTVGSFAFDKHQLATGGPTGIVELRKGPDRGELERWLTAQVVDVEASPDAESAATIENAQGNSVPPASSGTPSGTGGVTGLHADGDLPAPTDHPGGGSPELAGGEKADGSIAL